MILVWLWIWRSTKNARTAASPPSRRRVSSAQRPSGGWFRPAARCRHRAAGAPLPALIDW